MFLHYTNAELKIENIIDKTNHQDNSKIKPVGLWVSYNDEWKKWCEKEGFSTCDMGNCNIYKLDLVEDAILKIDTLENFCKTYEFSRTEMCHFNSIRINWVSLCRKYQGLIVLNYEKIKKELREKYSFEVALEEFCWFFSLDVSSGCIWNPKCIKGIEKL